MDRSLDRDAASAMIALEDERDRLVENLVSLQVIAVVLGVVLVIVGGAAGAVIFVLTSP